MQPKVYIVLVNWNGWRDTLLCLESVLRLDYQDFVVVVCDNDSTDQSLEQIKRWCAGTLEAEGGNPELAALTLPPVPKPIPYVDLDRCQAESGYGPESGLVLIRTGGNLGFAGGNNVGFRYAMARGDAAYVWALNNDTIVPPDSLVALVGRMKISPEIGICGSTVCFMMRPQIAQALGGAAYNPWLGTVKHMGLAQPVPTDIDVAAAGIEKRLSYVFGASMLASRAFLEKAGLMQEDYFLFFEELDWAERARKEGFRLGYSPASRVFHRAGAATGSAEETAFSLYFLNRNRLRFIRRFFPRFLALNYLLLWIEVGKALAKGRFAKAKAIACALLGIALFCEPALSR